MNDTTSVAAPEAAEPRHPAASEDRRVKASIAYEKEIRIAAVMYGGVSLAIYINGVAQELLRLVRATAAKEPGSAEPLLRDDELAGVERLYRQLGCLLGGEGLDPSEALRRGLIRTRFVVDILSGTSAGGINGIFLACALARHQTMDQLKQLWITEGDLQKLLNDAGSVGDLDRRLPVPKKPRSLLNSRRMYIKLLEALEGMKGSAPLREKGQSALVDELDLFVTATDLQGLVVKLRLADQLVYERRYRNVFHFVHATEHGTGSFRNDLVRGNNGFLAFAARCTSSFPAAFEPMTLKQATDLLGPLADDPEVIAAMKHWPDFYRDYRDPRSVPGREQDPIPAPFEGRPFGDGGYLDNKPFGYAISALRRRRADLPMERKLFYVEPSPEHPELDPRDSNQPPDALQNLMLATSTLPRKETIRGDLERLLDRNRQIEYVSRATRTVGLDFHLPPDDGGVAPQNRWGSKWLCEIVRVPPGPGLPPYGGAYGAYHRLRVSEVTSEMADLITRVIGLDPEADEGVAVRYVLSAWRQTRYLADPDPAFPGVVPENQFLAGFDLSYRLRRLRFVQDRLQMFLDDDRHCNEVLAVTEPRPADEKPEDCAKAAERLRARIWSGRSKAERHHVRESLHAVLRALAEVQVRLRAAGRTLRKPGEENPLHRKIGELELNWDDLKHVLRAPDSESRIVAARAILGIEADGRVPVPAPGRLGKLNDLADGIAADLSRTFAAASEAVEAALHPRHAPPGLSDLGRRVRHCLWHHYRRFDYFDMVLFPMVAGTDLGELQSVDVLRVSPEDAVRLVAERDPNTHQLRCPKLAGTRLGHFGAFLDAIWRRSDIMWGRLDGAERIVRGIVPPRPPAATGSDPLEDLLGRLQSEIVREELEQLDPETARRVFVEALLHTRTGMPDYKRLDDFLERILAHLEDPAVRRILAPDLVRSAYTTCFELYRDLDRERQLRLMARGTQIFGRMLDVLAERYAEIRRWMAAWVVGSGRVLAGLVEIAVPRTVWELLGEYWLSLLYGLEVALVVGGQLLAGGYPARNLGVLLLLVTYAADLGRLVVAAYVRRAGWRPIAWILGAGAAATFLLGAARVGQLVADAIRSYRANPLPWREVSLGFVGLVAVVWVMRRVHHFLLRRRR
jgi:patatin-related protein